MKLEYYAKEIKSLSARSQWGNHLTLPFEEN
jgi:hypothetical protein